MQAGLVVEDASELYARLASSVERTSRARPLAATKIN